MLKDEGSTSETIERENTQPSEPQEEVDLEKSVMLIYKMLEAYNEFLEDLIEAEEETKITLNSVNKDLFESKNLHRLIELGPDKIGHLFTFILSLITVTDKLQNFFSLTTKEKKRLHEEINKILEQNKELLEVE